MKAKVERGYFAAIQQTLSQSFGAADQVGAIDNGCDLLLLQIDRQRKTLKIGLGGISLMLYRRNSQTVQWVESPRSGISAKLESLTRISGCGLSYHAGDRLLFVTDGVTYQIGGPQNPRAYGYRGMQEPLLEQRRQQRRCSGASSRAFCSRMARCAGQARRRHDLVHRPLTGSAHLVTLRLSRRPCVRGLYGAGFRPTTKLICPVPVNPSGPSNRFKITANSAQAAL